MRIDRGEWIAVFVEVGLDPDLGEIRFQVGAALSARRIVNRALTTSQYTGGLIGGIGMTLHERSITDETTGRIISDGFADHLIPHTRRRTRVSASKTSSQTPHPPPRPLRNRSEEADDDDNRT